MCENNVRPIEAGHLGERVDYCVRTWPWERWRIGGWAALDVIRGMVENEVAVGLLLLAIKRSADD